MLVQITRRDGPFLCPIKLDLPAFRPAFCIGYLLLHDKLPPKPRCNSCYLRRVSESQESRRDFPGLSDVWAAEGVAVKGMVELLPSQDSPGADLLLCLLTLLLEGLRFSLAVGCRHQSWSQTPLQSLLSTRQLAGLEDQMTLRGRVGERGWARRKSPSFVT